jgi:hypothetical protein
MMVSLEIWLLIPDCHTIGISEPTHNVIGTKHSQTLSRALPALSYIQLGTNKRNKFIISGTRFFGKNLMTDLKPDRQKELKNGVFMLFPRFLAAPNF